MKTIEIDDEVYEYLESKAIPFEEKSPNDVMRRLFELDEKAIPQRIISIPQDRFRVIRGRKQRKANLIELVNAGVLEEGQVLHLRDYRGDEIQDSESTVHQGGLHREGEKYSMSKLAEKLLKKQGFFSNSVQGPARWFTSDNISIKMLWDNYLKKKKIA